MFNINKIEVKGYEKYTYKVYFECGYKNYIFEKFDINERECEVNGNNIIVEVDRLKLINILNILEGIKIGKKSFSFFNSKSNDNIGLKVQDYEFLLNYYKEKVIDDFIEKHDISNKQIEYIKEVLGNTNYKLYEEVLNNLADVFGLIKVESELTTKLEQRGLNINIEKLNDNIKKLILKVLNRSLFSNKFIYVMFSSNYSYEYLNSIFGLILNEDIEVDSKFEVFIVKLTYECFNIDDYFYTKFEKELKEYLYEN